MIEAFKKDVQNGLSSTPKTLPSKYFYDTKGDALFVEIMNLPEYYLTQCELDIFKNKTQELINALQINPDSYFELIELGAGDGLKTKELLKVLVSEDYNFDYFPIDISANALSLLKSNLEVEIPGLSVKTQQGDYFEVLDTLKESQKTKVILFLGSNIGNMTNDIASRFIDELANSVNKGDRLLLGVDLIKSEKIVGPAYDDSQGITSQFNLNLLRRINSELGGNFNLDKFQHESSYSEKSGLAKSYIKSLTNQTVEIKSIGESYHFQENEKILTEVSQKYDDDLLDNILADTDFKVITNILDSKSYFADYILERN